MPSGQGKNLIRNKSHRAKQIAHNHINYVHYAAQKNKMAFYVAEVRQFIRVLLVNWTRTFKFNINFVEQQGYVIIIVILKVRNCTCVCVINMCL